MLKLKDHNESVGILGKDIPVGKIAILVRSNASGEWIGSLVMGTSHGLVNLSENAGEYWSTDCLQSNNWFEILTEGTVLEI